MQCNAHPKRSVFMPDLTIGIHVLILRKHKNSNEILSACAYMSHLTEESAVLSLRRHQRAEGLLKCMRVHVPTHRGKCTF